MAPDSSFSSSTASSSAPAASAAREVLELLGVECRWRYDVMVRSLESGGPWEMTVPPREARGHRRAPWDPLVPWIKGPLPRSTILPSGPLLSAAFGPIITTWSA